jgi:hypothetical protein
MCFHHAAFIFQRFTVRVSSLAWLLDWFLQVALFIRFYISLYNFTKIFQRSKKMNQRIYFEDRIGMDWVQCIFFALPLIWITIPKIRTEKKQHWWIQSIKMILAAIHFCNSCVPCIPPLAAPLILFTDVAPQKVPWQPAWCDPLYYWLHGRSCKRDIQDP